MQEFIIIDGLPYLLHGDKAYSVRWDKTGFSVGGVFRDGISPTDYPVMQERAVIAKCQGRLDSIGTDTAVAEDKPKRRRKKGDAE